MSLRSGVSSKVTNANGSYLPSLGGSKAAATTMK